MSKGDGDKDETPIQFYIPRISSRGRAPIPINQPHWKYASDYTTPPRIGDWLFSTVITVIGIAIMSLVFTELGNFPKLLFIVFGMILIYSSAQLTIVRLWKYRRFKINLQESETREKPEKKQPKRRKDYR